jgi:hypothetical protein
MYCDHLALENYAISFHHTTDTRFKLLPCHSHGVPQLQPLFESGQKFVLIQTMVLIQTKQAASKGPTQTSPLEFVVVVTLYWHRAFKIQSCYSSWHRLAGNKLGSDPVIK